MSRNKRNKPTPPAQRNNQPTPQPIQQTPPQGNDAPSAAIGNVQRVRVTFDTLSIDLEALKALENTTVSSCLELVKRVIVLDGKHFGDITYTNAKGQVKNIKLTAGRKTDYLRLIECYAEINFIGIKCHIVKVFNDSDREKLGDFFLQKRMDKMKYT